MKISELTPTQSRLLLDPYGLKGRDLVISAIYELLVLGYLIQEQRSFKGENHPIIFDGMRPRAGMQKYQTMIMRCVDEHYRFYPTSWEINTALTPARLVRDVYGAVKFNYFKFKQEYLYPQLRKLRLFRTLFPFYYLKSPYTQKGLGIKKRIEEILVELEENLFLYKIENPKKITALIAEIGPNILLARNLSTIVKELKVMKEQSIIHSSATLFLHDETFIMYHLLEQMDFELPNIELVDFEWSNFEIPSPLGDG